MKLAFTLIELIFVIVILGIIAAIAIPKLSATRYDALIITEINNLVNCINNVGSSYTAQSKEDQNIPSCNNLKCSQIDYGDPLDGNITVTVFNTATYPKYCKKVKELADQKMLEGIHKFGGSSIEDY